MSDQAWQIAVTPAQRLNLYLLVRDGGQKVKGQEGRKYRRFMRAFGLDIIADTVLEHGGAAIRGKAREPALHTVTAENIEWLFKVRDEIDRSTEVEALLGPLFDLADDCKGGKEVPPCEALTFDASAEDWKPSPKSHGAAVATLLEAVKDLPVEKVRELIARADEMHPSAPNGAGKEPGPPATNA